MADAPPPEEVSQGQDEVKACTANVYAATPSSGSGGGEGGAGEEEDEREEAPVETPRVSIPELVQNPEEENSKSEIISEWVNHTVHFTAENPEVKDEDVVEPPKETESMEIDESITEACDPSAEDKNQERELEDEGLPSTFKIFVSNLPPGLFNSELMELFDQYGEVVQCELFAKNYAFVHMTSEESGVRALEALNGMELRGCKINVKRSMNSNSLGTNPKSLKPKEIKKMNQVEELEPGVEIGTYKIYIGNMFPDVTKEYITTMLEPFGRPVEIEIFRSTSAFVHMETEEGGKKAIEELNEKTLPDCEKPLVVSESKNQDVGPSLATIKLLVKNLAVSVTAPELRELFTPYGLVLKVSLSSKLKSSTHRTATVYLEQLGNIRSAIKELTGKEIGGSSITVVASFDKPEPIKPAASSFSKSNQSNKPQDPYGAWQPADTPSFRSKPYHQSKPFDWGPPGPAKHHMRLIPMPSKDDLVRLPRSGQGRRLLNPAVQPPPLMPDLVPRRPPRGGNPFMRNNDYSYNQAMYEGYGGGYSNYEQEEFGDCEVYDWSQYSGGNDYAPSPMKIPRKNPWNNTQNFPQNFQQNSQQNWNQGWGKSKNKGNNNAKQKNSPFPKLPSANDFPIGPPPPSLMSVQVPNAWTGQAQQPMSNYTSFSNDEDFTSDDPVEPKTSSLNAIPFDYSQMKSRKNFSGKGNQQQQWGNQQQQQQQWNSNSNFGSGTNFYGNAKGKGKAGKGNKGRARHPGLGTPQQQKKAAQQSGNDDFFTSESAGAGGNDWNSWGNNASAKGETGTATSSNNAYAPYYQQNANFAPMNPNKQGNRKPTARQIKDAEEEQKKQYADFLKQKPWLYQAIPGTVKKVNQ